MKAKDAAAVAEDAAAKVAKLRAAIAVTQASIEAVKREQEEKAAVAAAALKADTVVMPPLPPVELPAELKEPWSFSSVITQKEWHADGPNFWDNSQWTPEYEKVPFDDVEHGKAEDSDWVPSCFLDFHKKDGYTSRVLLDDDGNWHAGKLQAGTAPDLVLPNGDIYKGELKDGKPHGRGLMIYSAAAPGRDQYTIRYLGRRGDPNSRWGYDEPGTFSGKLRRADGTEEVFSGDKDWERAGRATVCRPHVYDGEWVAGRRHGFGVYEWAVHTLNSCWNLRVFQYQGAWQNGKKHGRGCEFLKHFERAGMTRALNMLSEQLRGGQKFDGHFVNGLRSGRGVLLMPINLDKAKATSSGTYGLSDLWLYDGNFADNLPDGQGSLTQLATAAPFFDPTGAPSKVVGLERYVGQFQAGRLHGRGTLTRMRPTTFRNVPDVDVAVAKASQHFPPLERGDKIAAVMKEAGFDARVFGGFSVVDPGVKGSEAEAVYDGYWRAGVPHGRGISCQTRVTKEDGAYNIGFQVGASVAANYKGEGQFYKAKIKTTPASSNGRHGFTLQYGDGKEVTDVDPKLFKLLSRSYRVLRTEKYDGQWWDGQRHGLGTMRVAVESRGDVPADGADDASSCPVVKLRACGDGAIKEGRWVSGTLQPKGAVRWCDQCQAANETFGLKPQMLDLLARPFEHLRPHQNW